jgi:hypothetical protein
MSETSATKSILTDAMNRAKRIVPVNETADETNETTTAPKRFVKKALVVAALGAGVIFAARYYSKSVEEDQSESTDV